MKSLVVLYSILLLSLVYANDEVCILNKAGFHICTKSGHISRIHNTEKETHLRLAFKSNVTIDSNAFAETGLQSIQLGFMMKKGLFEKSPKYLLSLNGNSFSGLPNLTSLELVNMPVNFTGRPLEPLTGLKSFKWVLSELLEVPSEQLAAVPHLEELPFFTNSLTVLRSKAFGNMTNLKSLKLSRNHINKLEMGCFDGLENLEELDMSLSNFTSLPAVFGDMKKLRVLHMDGGALETIEPNAFRGLSNLQDLLLEGTRLKHLPLDAFSYLPRLRLLRLNGFHGLNITKGLVNDIHSLEELYLSNVNTSLIGPESFSGLNLTLLSLHTCNARQPLCIYEILAGAPPNPKYAKPYTIAPKAFHGLTVKKMDLSANAFTKIGAEDFAGLTADVLDLTFNDIDDIAPDAFKDTKVDKVILDKNPIQGVNKTAVGLLESTIVVEGFRMVDKKKYENDDDDE